MSERNSDGEGSSRIIVTPEEFGLALYHKVWEQVIGPGISAANAALRTARFNPPARLMHFTSAAGLEAILRTSILRLSRARASNDPMELEYGLELARGIVGDLPAPTVEEREFGRALVAGTQDGWVRGERAPPT